MEFTVEVCKFSYTAETYQKAYLKGCKSLARYIASSKYKNICFKAEKAKEEGTFVFILFTKINASYEQRHFCKMCKDMHKNFFINEEYNCKRCNLKSFLARASGKAKVSKQFYREKIY